MDLYEIGSTVFINNGAIECIITAIILRQNRVAYEVVYYDGLTRKTEVVEEFEITLRYGRCWS